VQDGRGQDGEPFGRFMLLRRLGAGGMAEVYLARLPGVAGFERHVVIKRILPALSGDPEFVERLIQEGKLAAGLSHGNIVHIFELGQEAGEYYLAMEYVAGTDLREVVGALRRGGGALPQALAAHILLQVARALAYAHGKTDPEGAPLGIVHRDVSPANVLVSWEGEIKLTDFGIARMRQEGPVLTAAGMLRGKVPYMSPEQVAGEPLGPATDVFSFGVLAWELLTGQRPFDGESDLQTLDRIRACEHPPLRSLCPDLDEGLAALVEGALEPDRTRRPASAAELERGLAGLMVARGWVVAAGDVAGLLENLFPRGCAERSRAPATGITGSRSSAGTGRRGERIPTRSMAQRTRRRGAGFWLLVTLAVLLATGAVGFGLGLLWDGGARGPIPTPGPGPGNGVPAAAPDAAAPPAGPPDVIAQDPQDATEPPAPDTTPPQDLRAPDLSSPDVVPAPEDAAGTTPDIPDVVSEDTRDIRPSGDAGGSDGVSEDRDHGPGEAVGPAASVTRIDVLPPEAEISIGGEVVGTTAHVLRLLPGETAAVRLSCPGYEEESFELRHPAPRKVSKRLRPIPMGSVRVRFLPASATLYLDGKPLAAEDGLNIVAAGCPAGPHVLRLVAPDGREVTREVQVAAGEELGITLQVE